MNTAKLLITNVRTDLFAECWIKQNKQLYIQTWHGLLPLKRIEKDAEKNLLGRYVYMAKRDSMKCDLILSGCRYSTNNIKMSFWYDGEILEKGLPRNTALFVDNTCLKHRIFKRYNISESAKIILYAPTFRSNYTQDFYITDWNDIRSAMSSKDEGVWFVLLRLHPNMPSRSMNICNDHRTIDVTEHPDMQELLAICDVLITDYSSSMFDAALALKPCLIYAPDVDKFDRGLYFNMRELPFPIANNLNELIYNISSFNRDEYNSRINKFNNDVGMVDAPYNANKEIYCWIKHNII